VARLRALHADGVFVLPNAWDGRSTAPIAVAGAPVVVMTSARISLELGRPDGGRLTRHEMVAGSRMYRRRGGATALSASTSREAAGRSLWTWRSTVTEVISVFDTAAQADRLRAPVRGAEGAGLPEFTGSARTDVFLFGVGEADARLVDVLARAAAYVAGWNEFEVGPHDGERRVLSGSRTRLCALTCGI